MENIKYNKKSRTDISRSVPWPRAKTMPLDEPAKMIMNRFSIIENYLICNDKQWTNFSIGFLRLKRRFPWFNAVPDRSGCIDACREGRIKLNKISRNICQISNWLWQFENSLRFSLSRCATWYSKKRRFWFSANCHKNQSV